MTTDDKPGQRSQRTVAELLAQYGESAAPGRRRARREPEDEPSGSTGGHHAEPTPNGASGGPSYGAPQPPPPEAPSFGSTGGPPRPAQFDAAQFDAPQFDQPVDQPPYGQAPPPQYGHRLAPEFGQPAPPPGPPDGSQFERSQFERSQFERSQFDGRQHSTSDAARLGYSDPPQAWQRSTQDLGQRSDGGFGQRSTHDLGARPRQDYRPPAPPEFGPPAPRYPGAGPDGPAGGPYGPVLDDEPVTAPWQLDRRRAPEVPPAQFVAPPQTRWAPGAPTQDNPTEQLPRFTNWPNQRRDSGQLNGDNATVVGQPGLAPNQGLPTGAMSPEELLEADSAAFDHPVDLVDPDVAGDPAADSAAGELVEAAGADADEDQDGAGQPEAEAASPTKLWFAMVGQWIAGALGGAALWVAFRYLWGAVPIVALVAAVLVIAGLVLLVRAIRRSDDLKTTVFAVLVGLVVTVSPAVLVLVDR